VKAICTDVFEFDELDAEAKEKARAWYRDAWSDDTFWSEHIVEELKDEIGPLCGFTIKDVYWRGFWSQSDGASFVGSWHASDVDATRLKAYAPQDTELRRIADGLAKIAAAYPSAAMEIKARGYGCHELCTEFWWTDFDSYDALPADRDAEEEARELARDLMRWLYRSLEKEYEWTNADEQVDDSIRANEYTFTADGRRFG
jgi:hypothetical protein